MNDSTWARPFSVLFSPTATFRSIAARPTWLAALVVIVAAGLIGTYAVIDKIDFESAVRAELAEQGQTSEEDIEQAVGFMRRFGAVFAWGGALLAPWVVFPLIAAVFFVPLRILGAKGLGFAGSLAVATHGFMPQVLKGLLGVPLALGRSEISNEELQSGLLPSSLNAFIGTADQSQVLTVLYQSVDFFHVWTALLLAIGYQHVAGVSRGKAWGTVIGLWSVWIAIRIGWALVTQSLA